VIASNARNGVVAKSGRRIEVTFTRNDGGSASVNLGRNWVDSRYLAGRYARTNAGALRLMVSIGDELAEIQRRADRTRQFDHVDRRESPFMSGSEA
jgi:hypothetical protein